MTDKARAFQERLEKAFHAAWARSSPWLTIWFGLHAVLVVAWFSLGVNFEPVTLIITTFSAFASAFVTIAYKTRPQPAPPALGPTVAEGGESTHDAAKT